MAVTTYIEAGRRAVAEALRGDTRVVALGEDLGRGGVFGQYKGLQQEFGAARVIDTPISEATIMGAAVGMALVGHRPVVEMRFSDFALCATDAAAYRKAEEVAAQATRDPLRHAAARLTGLGVDPKALDEIDGGAKGEIDRAYAHAKAAPWPADALAYSDIQDIGFGQWR